MATRNDESWYSSMIELENGENDLMMYAWSSSLDEKKDAI
jgi:hypothetical protein